MCVSVSLYVRMNTFINLYAYICLCYIDVHLSICMYVCCFCIRAPSWHVASLPLAALMGSNHKPTPENHPSKEAHTQSVIVQDL